VDDSFYVTQDELTLQFGHGSGERQLSYDRWSALDPQAWRARTKGKLAELLGLDLPVRARSVRMLRQTSKEDVKIAALLMRVSGDLTIPAYLLEPQEPVTPSRAVMAIHGHGEVEPCIGARDDYHHMFALELARRGRIVLCPELRGFGVLKDLALHGDGTRLDYWNWGGQMAYSLVSEGMLHSRPLIGATVEDLLAWENWLAGEKGFHSVDVAGISYGGDLALTYPVFSDRVERIFASGTLGSFSVVFSRCYNAPAHAIPGILCWMDRSDIAGLNAPRPLAIHYGELDAPSPQNFSASYNETVPGSLDELRAIYRAFGAEGAVQLIVSSGKAHEMDNRALDAFFGR